MNTHLTASTAMPQTNALIATVVPGNQRSRFWPQHFGNIPQWLVLEPRVFGWLDRFCADYHGGLWDFYTISNGGAFLVPDTDKEYVLFNALNGNGATVGQEAAGITACLMAYSHHACRTESEAMTDHFYRLREYALHHPESRAIFALID
ncbi:MULTISPECIES: antirestriction protein [unclassified Serratia (in: enterobacteria)]|uniref:antirestriction protein n=1 Tax=unclassified Serratia (in: enterobacteria) TaxID=2647522 RepID=UPI001CBC640B|nr:MULTISPECIES: antirestriction protein [unclassified Serratia (in: enterobacteria)]UAN51617.1 antirestriction protein [Serratia sp. JSRIV002]UAN57620.1 antirestriction protein [Serratia sp. JSRIV004]